MSEAEMDDVRRLARALLDEIKARVVGETDSPAADQDFMNRWRADVIMLARRLAAAHERDLALRASDLSSRALRVQIHAHLLRVEELADLDIALADLDNALARVVPTAA